MKVGTIVRSSSLFILVFAAGCGGQPSHKLSPAAKPIGITLKKALDANNSSDVAGQVVRAREQFNANAITKVDLDLILKIEDMTSLNRWNDARKAIEEALE